MKTKLLILMLTVCLLFSVSACGESGNNTDRQNNTAEISSESSNADEIYQSIMDSSRMEASEAYDMLKNLDLDGKPAGLRDRLEELLQCQGMYRYYSDSTQKVYTADLEFYLVCGEPQLSIDYTGYMGTIDDGAVVDSSDSDYVFESLTTGQLGSNSQDFTIRISPEKVRIMWGDVCDYLLDRGSGAADDFANEIIPIEKSELFQTIEGILDDSYSSYEHMLFADEDGNLWFVLDMEVDRDTIIAGKDHPDMKDAWKTLVTNLETVGERLATALDLSDYRDATFNLILVDDIYDEDPTKTMAYYGVDGVTVYDVTKDTGANANIAGKTTNSSGSSASANSSSSGYNHTATMGEKNALETAKSYLSIMAFSYSGLIEQLEYEGYSTSEATYAVDNCGANWNEQAVKMAKSYLEIMSFSRSELIEQLEYEGFTYSQAEYGVKGAGY